LLQLFPGGLELRLSAFVFVAVHSGVLDENVQAMNKRARGGGTRTLRCVYGRDKELLVSARLKLQRKGKR
jgi:hypothetical protein